VCVCVCVCEIVSACEYGANSAGQGPSTWNAMTPRTLTLVHRLQRTLTLVQGMQCHLCTGNAQHTDIQRALYIHTYAKT
jgi:hypothetical protein